MPPNPHAWGAGRTSELGCGARGRWRVLAAVPVGGGGSWLRCPWAVAGAASEKSHAIRLGEVSTKVENVAIPTIQFQNLKGSWGIACEIGGGLSNDVDPHQHTGPHWYGGRRRARGPGCGTRGRRRGRDWTHGMRGGGTKLAQQEPHRATAGQNSPCASLLTACAIQNSPCSPKMAQFGAFYPRMANFLPLPPPTSHAGRTMYRIQAGCRSSKHNNTTGHTSVKVSRGSNK